MESKVTVIKYFLNFNIHCPLQQHDNLFILHSIVASANPKATLNARENTLTREKL